MTNFYGLCPKCGAQGLSRERRPNGNDKCVNGCVYPSSEAVYPNVGTQGHIDHDKCHANCEHGIPEDKLCSQCMEDAEIADIEYTETAQLVADGKREVLEQVLNEMWDRIGDWGGPQRDNFDSALKELSDVINKLKAAIK